MYQWYAQLIHLISQILIKLFTTRSTTTAHALFVIQASRISASTEACGIKDIEWVNVHTNPGAVSEIGVSLNHVRKRLYVKDLNGQLNVGADTFILWSQTNGQRWLAKLSWLPVFKQLSRLMYNLFAHLLYRWNCTKRHW